MGILGNLVVNLLADTKKFDQQMQKSMTGVQKFAANAHNLGESLTKAGRKMSLMVTGPILAFGVASVKLASDAEEMGSKFNVVFGNMAEQTEEWAATYGDAIGRSRYTLMELLATLQDTFVPMGFARDQAAHLSTAMVQLAVDVGSFNNVATPDVIRDFQSALVGNHETVRKYGVVITQATIEQELMAMGINKSIKEATTQEKVMARLNIIIKGTTDAQGDAVRTADSFANRFRALKEAGKDLFVVIGNLIIPKVSEFVEKIKNVIKWISSLDQGTLSLIIKIAGIAAAIGPVLIVIGTLSKSLMLLMNPVGIVLVGIAALGTAAFLLYKNWDKVSKFLKDLWNDLADFVNKIFQNMKLAIMVPIREILEFLLKIAGAFKKVFKGIDLQGLQNALDKVNGKISETHGKIEDLGPNFERTGEHIKDAGEKIKDLIEKLKNLIKGFKGATEDGEKLNDFGDEFQKTLDGIMNSLKPATDGINDLSEKIKKTDEEMEKFGETIFYTGEQMDGLTASAYYARIGQELLKNQTEELTGAYERGFIPVADLVSARLHDYHGALVIAKEGTEEATQSVTTFGEALKSLQQTKEQLLEFTANQFTTGMTQAWEDIWFQTGDTAKKLKDAIKDMISSFLKALGKQYIVLAIANWFRPFTALKYAAASAAFFSAARFVQSLQKGADFVTQGPQLLMVGDNPGGRERVQVTPMSSPNKEGPREMIILQNTFKVGESILYKEVQRGIDNRHINVKVS